LPRKVDVSRVTPSQVTFHLDRMAKRSVPVRLERSGEVPAGLRLKELALIPEKVDVTGPKGRLDGLQAVLTAPLVLGYLEAGTNQVDLNLVQPGALVQLESPAIRVRTVVEPVLAERQIRKVPIAVRDAASPWQVKPESVTVVVRGPEIELRELDLEPGAAFVEARELDAARAHRVKPQVALPSGIELVRVEPSEVTLEPARGSAQRGGESADKPREKKT
jgi:YbbR domain-containing protein